MKKKKINLIVGSIGAFIGVFVFITYIPQIIANLEGVKAQPWQPLTDFLSNLGYLWMDERAKKGFYPYRPEFNWCDFRLSDICYSHITYKLGYRIKEMGIWDISCGTHWRS